ncbi:sensor histidine kinase [Teichococcus aestuarii]|uniref:sensor histidine kinase n=1 Tax=Teichococcus aestuarii TaxID=568898 RepID=UPI0036169D74
MTPFLKQAGQDSRLWLTAGLAVGLLFAGMAATSYQLLYRNGENEQRLQSLEGGLQDTERLLALLDERREGGGSLEAVLASLARLAAAEPPLAPAQRGLAAAVARLQGAPDTGMVDMAGLVLERTIRTEMRRLRAEERHQERVSLSLGLAGMGAGGSLLLAGLFSARWRERQQARGAQHKGAELRAICKATPAGLALLDGECRLREINPGFAALAGQPEARLLGRHLAEAMPLLGGLLLPMLRGALARGEGLPGQEVQVMAPGGRSQHYFIAAEPVLGGGAEARLSLVVMDISDKAAIESWRKELVAELNHRVKNTLSTVQSLAAQTMRGAGQDPNRFAADFSARLGALSRSHELLASVGWSKATLDGAIEAALAPWKAVWLATGQLVMHGPSGVVVRPAQAQAMVIAISELASNASRHGALAHDGRVTLTWRATPNGVIHFSWHEHGKMRLREAPPQRGFGLRFLERGLAHDLGQGARAELRFEQAGLQYDVSFRAGGVQPSTFTLQKGAA